MKIVVIIKVICIYEHGRKIKQKRYISNYLRNDNDCGIYLSTLKAFEGFR